MNKLRYSIVGDVKPPVRSTPKSAGIDFYLPRDQRMHWTLTPGEDVLIPSGIHVQIPLNHCLVAIEKSGRATRDKLSVGARLIDEDYQGELHLHVYNFSQETVTLFPDEKLVQFVCVPVNYVELEQVDFDVLYDFSTKRGDGGFGSTGLE